MPTLLVTTTRYGPAAAESTPVSASDVLVAAGNGELLKYHW